MPVTAMVDYLVTRRAGHHLSRGRPLTGQGLWESVRAALTSAGVDSTGISRGETALASAGVDSWHHRVWTALASAGGDSTASAGVDSTGISRVDSTGLSRGGQHWHQLDSTASAGVTAWHQQGWTALASAGGSARGTALHQLGTSAALASAGVDSTGISRGGQHWQQG